MLCGQDIYICSIIVYDRMHGVKGWTISASEQVDYTVSCPNFKCLNKNRDTWFTFNLVLINFVCEI